MSDAGLKERAQEELRNYLIVSAYLCVAFAVLMLYENSLLRQEAPACCRTGSLSSRRWSWASSS